MAKQWVRDEQGFIVYHHPRNLRWLANIVRLLVAEKRRRNAGRYGWQRKSRARLRR